MESTMNRWMQLCYFGAVVATGSASGWGGAAPATQAPYLESNFPMQANQQWFMKETYLFP